MIEHKRYEGKTDEEVRSGLLVEGFIPVLEYDDAGYFYEPHSHETTNIIVILQGEMTVTIDDKTVTLSRGDRVTFLPDMLHEVQVGAEKCVYFWVEF